MDAELDGARQGDRDRRAGGSDPDALTLTEPALSDRQQRRILLPVLTVVFLAALDLTVVAPILPSVLDDLQINPVDADKYSWIVLSYLVAYTVTVPITGRISDFAGRIPVFTAAMVLFLAGSVLVAISQSLSLMIVGRTLQGLGGGAMLPVSMALVADVVPRHRRAAALGMVAAVDTFGWVLGPVWGAAIYGMFDSWRAIFWLNLPLGMAAAALLFTNRLPVAPRRREARPSLLSALVGTIGLVGVCLALSTGSEGSLGAEQGAARLGGSTNPLADYRFPILVVSLVAFAAFVVLERRAETPILPRALVRSRVFQIAGGANVLVGAALITAMVNAPLAVALLVDEDNVSRDTALLLGSLTIAMTIGALAGGRAVDRAGPRLTAMTGLMLGALGFVTMRSWPDEFVLSQMSITIALAGLGLGVVIAPIGEVAIRAARTEDYGAASGLVLLARLLGMTIGLSVITAYGLERLNQKVDQLPE
ncbi:MAG TPA: MFS transporter, partial [Thermomicrobiales bacterium]|nr:MFS transporter [Thermomicrobiales bacterium]